MRPVRILYVVGTRPNFVKMAPVIAALRARLPDARHTLVHTGQHYDRLMSDVFFEELGMPEPDHMLEVGSGSHAEQTARVMERLEPVLARRAARPGGRPRRRQLDPGGGARRGEARASRSPTSRPACAASTARCPRRSTGSSPTQLSELLFLHSTEAIENLRAEGIADERDPLRRQHDDRHAGRARGPLPRARRPRSGSGSSRAATLLVTLHRPALVDGPLLGETMAALARARAPRCRSSSRSTRGPARCSRRRSAAMRRGCGSSSRSATSTSSRSRPTPAPCSPTPAGSRRRPPTSASRASRCATTPSAR